MSLNNFVQEDQIEGWVQEQIALSSIAYNVMAVKTGVKASSIQFPVANSGTLRDKTEGQDLLLTNVTSSKVNITLDNEKYMLENIDNVMSETAAQAIAPQTARDMGNQFATNMDSTAFASLFADAGVTPAKLGITTSPVAITTSALADAYMLDIRNTLVTAKINLKDSFALVPVNLGGWLVQLNSASNRQGQNGAAFESGYITTVYGVDVYETTDNPTGVAGGLVDGEYAVIAGHKRAGSLAISYDKTETGSSMPTRDGEYMYQAIKSGSGANNASLIVAGVVTL